MTWKKRNSERLKKRILDLSIAGMTQAAIAEKIHRSQVFVSRALKRQYVQIQIAMMSPERAMEIMQTLNRWELLLLLRTIERTKNYGAVVCLFNREHQRDVSDLLPYLRKNKYLQQKLKNILSPPKK